MNTKILKTREKLRDALQVLLTARKLDDITVSELCAKARINRTTFYKYYALPADVLREYFIEINDEVLNVSASTFAPTLREDTLEKMSRICQVYYENRRLVQIYGTNMQDFLTMISHGLARSHPGQTGGLRENSLVYFLAGGVAAIILQWALQGFVVPRQEVSQMLTDYICRLQIG